MDAPDPEAEVVVSQWEVDSVSSFEPPLYELARFEDSEDVGYYKEGGFHPVHLGDVFDERYRIVHKLGAGGFSTVWMAYDSLESVWVALKIVLASKSQEVWEKAMMCQKVVSDLNDTIFVTFKRYFHFDGPNGQHLCLVQPLLGPSSYAASRERLTRMRPNIARQVASQVTKAVGELHSRGICHGDLTPSNIVFRTRSLDHLDDQGIYRLFGGPETDALQTTSGGPYGSEAPEYIVGRLDFLSSTEDILLDDMCLIDLDQVFIESAPPEKMLGIPIEYLAPEVAAGHPASQASYIWALGCTILQLRSGVIPFDVDLGECPGQLMHVLYEFFGELPTSWGDPLFDDDGDLTTDPAKGQPVRSEEKQSLRQWISQIWDEPQNLEELQLSSTPTPDSLPENMPYPACYAAKFWKPAAIRIGDTFLWGFGDTAEEAVKRIPKIPTDEVDMFHDLLSKIFVYEPAKRIRPGEILAHPWFIVEEKMKERKRKRGDEDE